MERDVHLTYPVYSIRDTKVGFDTQFIVQANEGAAKRGFSFMINNNQSVLGFSPADFELYHIADFDTVSGEMKSVFPPEFIINGGTVLLEK